jgi:hypothetical protein
VEVAPTAAGAPFDIARRTTPLFNRHWYWLVRARTSHDLDVCIVCDDSVAARRSFLGLTHLRPSEIRAPIRCLVNRARRNLSPGGAIVLLDARAACVRGVLVGTALSIATIRRWSGS